MSSDITTLKSALRNDALAARRALSAHERAAASVAVAQRIASWLPLWLAEFPLPTPGHLTVLAYAAHGSELDSAPAVDAIREVLSRRTGHTEPVIAYPRVEDDEARAVRGDDSPAGAPSLLRLHACDPRELTAGYRGILEPPPGATEVAPADIDVVLVPGVAFGRDGYRLGYGRGYYDLLLHAAPRALTVGLSYVETLYESVPHEPHDHPLSAVISPSEMITLSRRELS